MDGCSAYSESFSQFLEDEMDEVEEFDPYEDEPIYREF
ncbi:hypothetical protein SEA_SCOOBYDOOBYDOO_228 [Mycobacterium phage ScoobyDoobyDoo]|nr:hypothetical protein SEA_SCOOBYDOOBYDOO_228 [Mycobacterium phage ScoobyDoobyDoo]